MDETVNIYIFSCVRARREKLMHLCGSGWTDFLEIWYWRLLRPDKRRSYPSYASEGRDPFGPYIVTDVSINNPDNISNYEPVAEVAHYCMVL